MSTPTAVLIGLFAGIGCYFAVKVKDKLGWDDALDVWGVHGIGGVIGTICLGIFASTAINANGADGLIFGNVSFFLKQLVATLLASIYAFAFTYGMLMIINKITPVKVSKEEEELGLDSALHGETARDSQ